MPVATAPVMARIRDSCRLWAIIYFMRGHVLLVVVILTGSAVLTVGCSQHEGDAWTGSVTTISPVLCVGRHAATGHCFHGASKATLASLNVGECVAVVFGPADARGRYQLKAIKSVAVTAHKRDCALKNPGGG